MKSVQANHFYDSGLDEFEAVYVKPKAGRTLLVGSKVYEGRTDRRPLYADPVGVDMLPGEGVDYVANLEEPHPELGLFDHIECLSVLEHSKRPWDLARNLESMLVPGGSIFVSAPFVWRVHGYPDDYWRFTPNGIRQLFPGIEFHKVCLCNFHIESVQKITVVKSNGHPYLPRTETSGFGVKR